MFPGTGPQDELGLWRKFHTFPNKPCIPDRTVRLGLGTGSPLSPAAQSCEPPYHQQQPGRSRGCTTPSP